MVAVEVLVVRQQRLVKTVDRVVGLGKEPPVVLEISLQFPLLRVAMVVPHHLAVVVAQAELEPLVAQVEPQQVMAAQALFRQLQGFL